MDEIFSATCTDNTILFKTIIELLSNISSVNFRDGIKKSTIKQLSLKITKEGIEINSDNLKSVFASTFLNKHFFSSFEYDDEPICIGISVDILKSCFKYVHRTDILKITINKDEYSTFPSTICFSLNDMKGFTVKFHIVQNFDNEHKTNTKTMISLPSSRFSNLYREIGGIKKMVKIYTKDDHLYMSSTMVDIAENWVCFKLLDPSVKCNIEIKSEYFKIISKLSMFNSMINFNIEDNIVLSSEIKNPKSEEILGSITINLFI